MFITGGEEIDNLNKSKDLTLNISDGADVVEPREKKHKGKTKNFDFVVVVFCSHFTSWSRSPCSILCRS